MTHPFRLLLPLSLAALVVASCAGSFVEEMEETEATGNVPVAFSAATTDSQSDAASRAGAITTTTLNSMTVYAYHTWQNIWATNRYAPNFMFNQAVSKSNGTWKYTPVKYWPNTKGDYLTFFAYAPVTIPGLSVEAAVNYTGFPVLKYTVPTTNAESQHTDLLLAEPLTNLQKGDAPTFKMNHVMTRVQVKAKCTQDITVTNVKLNGARQKGTINLNNNPAATNLWSDISTTSTSFGYNKQTLVPANTTTHIAEYFMLPVTATELEFTFMNNGTSETKKVPLPTSPTWGQNKTIAYTLNIEVGSEVTLTAKGWDTSTGQVTGNMGQELPTNYPYVLNGVVYESATKSYYVGEAGILTFPYGTTINDPNNNGPGWYSWNDMMTICKKDYTSGPYPKREWRLPSKDELYNIRSLKDPSTGKTPAHGTTYWSSTENGANQAYVVWGEDGRPLGQAKAKTEGGRAVCIRDMGEITVYPTLRQTKDGYYIAYVDPSTTISIDFEYSTVGGHNSYGYRQYSSAESRCNGLSKGGYSWRLPEKAEIENLIQHVDVLKGCVVWTQTPNGSSSTTNVYVWHHTNGWSTYGKNSGLDAIAPCVRSN